MISINVDYNNVIKALNNIADKQLPFAASVALNNTAWKVKDDEVKALNQHLDRPTPFTAKAYQVDKATKQRLIASVMARPIQAKYLQYAVDGGSKSSSPKGKRPIVPAMDRYLNQYGNIPRGILPALAKDRKRFFSGRPKGRGASAEGLWQRDGNRLRLVVAYERSVQYKARLPFYEVAEASVRQNFEREFAKAISKALRTAR